MTLPKHGHRGDEESSCGLPNAEVAVQGDQQPREVKGKNCAKRGLVQKVVIYAPFMWLVKHGL